MKIPKKYSSLALVGGLVLIALFLAVIGPMVVRNNVPPPQGEARPAKGVTAKGLVESENDFELSTQAAGIIAEVKVRKGDTVRKGQVLVVIDSAKVRAKLSMAEAMLREAEGRTYRAGATLEQARLEYERQKRLYDRDATTLGELQRAEERYKAAEGDIWDMKSRPAEVGAATVPRTAQTERFAAEVAYYRALLKDYAVTSPVDGVVIERLKDPGESVDVGVPVLSVIDPLRMRIRAEVEETDVGKVAAGQPVEAWSDAYPNKIFKGEVAKVLPAVKRKQQRTFDPTTSFDINTQEVHIHLNEYTGLQSGMSVTIKFGVRPDGARQSP